MQPNITSQTIESARKHTVSAKDAISRIARKEITLFFASPIAYLFLATFAAISLFVFFWGEAFFARNISDVRPLFEWMPVLLIFLCATLTMRLWSEERRTGTLEHVLTQASPLWHFVVGKFLGCLFLLVVSLAITLPLPITVSIIGDLDWGPVWAGYLATLLLGASYLSIGLFVSARSDNQIVSLISACALSGLFYLVGTNTITDLVGNQAAEWLRMMGTGSRFDAITRGVIDFRDLYYYLSLVLVFLALNTWALEKERWAESGAQENHHNWHWLTALLVANALGANIWLSQINTLRVDVTQGQQYSISDATETYLNQLREPLLIRGYFSSKTHPLLAPLVPQLRDLIEEYEVVGNGKVRIEFIDPVSDPELEEEANRKYGIQPVPFQIADRYQSSIVSSYFNVLIQYGDEHQVLGFRDLIEVQQRSETDIDVQLRNPEHDLTRAIKTVLNDYQSSGNLFDTLKGDLAFKAYISEDTLLPKALQAFKADMQNVLEKTAEASDGRFTITIIDPEADGGATANQIAQDFGFKPMAAGLLNPETFFFYMTLQQGEQIVQLPLDDLTADSFERNLDAGIKRFAAGFTKTLALVVPENTPAYPGYGAVSGPQFNDLEAFLGAELNVIREDLSDGKVSGAADILFLAAPKSLDEKSLFAVDQFLMQGGTIIAATSPYQANISRQNLGVIKHKSGLEDWLNYHGLGIEEQLVLDPQNASFPIPVTRNVGGFRLQEMRMLDYPYFIDVRQGGLNRDHLIASELPQATITWASPIKVDDSKNQNRDITTLLTSSENAWLSDSLDIMPKVTQNGVSGFTPAGDSGKQVLGVISQGQFSSYFAGKPSPLVNNTSAETSATEAEETVAEEDAAFEYAGVIEKSPESARIILFSSNDFLRDQVIALAGSAQRSNYLNTLQLAANAVDWSLEDAGLLSIRSRGHFNRTLPPMDNDNQLFWESLNYGLAAFALIVIAVIERRYRYNKHKRYLTLLAH